MKDDNIFDKMKNAFTPVTTGTDGDGAEGLPLGMVQRGERMVYGYAFTVAQKLDAPVREDGPDAWGYQVTVPAGGAFRRGSGEWRRSHDGNEAHLWIESVGEVLEVAYVREGLPVWECYRGTEM